MAAAPVLPGARRGAPVLRTRSSIDRNVRTGAVRQGAETAAPIKNLNGNSATVTRKARRAGYRHALTGGTEETEAASDR